MPRGKSKKPGKIQKQMREKGLVEIVEEEVTFMCPKRGLVKQKVKIKKFKPFTVDGNDIVATKDTLAQIDELDNGLNMYDTDESGIE